MNGDYTTYHLTPEKKLPLVIEPANKSNCCREFFEILAKNRDQFKEFLLKNGALLFRNFPVHNERDFASTVKLLELGDFFDYKGGDSPRKQVAEGVYTSTEAPPWLKILLHNELSFSKVYPSHIFFYCDIQPERRGETPIADARAVFRSIDPKLKEKFIKNGLKYTSAYHGGKGLIPRIIKKGHRSWPQVFETDDPAEVEKICRERDISIEWNKNGWVGLSQHGPATNIHPITKEEVWFNQAHIFKLNPRFLGRLRYLAVQLIYFQKHTRIHDVTYGDGSEITFEEIYHIMDKLEENTVYFPWQKGDVLVLDNLLIMHGRSPFKGKRRILTSMTRK